MTRRRLLAAGASGAAGVYALGGARVALGAPARRAASGTVSFGSNASDPVPKKAYGFSVPVPDGSPVRGRGSVILGVRPTDLEHGAVADPALPRITIRPDVVEDLGAESHVIFTVDAPRVSAEAVLAATESPGDEGTLFADEHAVFTASLAGKLPVRAGSPLELALDPATFHFFDPATGLAVDRGPVAGVLTRP